MFIIGWVKGKVGGGSNNWTICKLIYWYQPMQVDVLHIYVKHIELKCRISTWLVKWLMHPFICISCFDLYLRSHFFLSNPYKWCKTSFNIYFFSSHCVPTSLLSLYRLFPCYESVYMLNDILFESLANTISNTSSDLKCCL